jgi:hypothetical protein
MGGKVVIVCLLGLLVIAGCVQSGGNGSGDGGESQVTTTGFACAARTTDCQGECVNLSSDDQNCGSCGRACPDGHYCYKGECAYREICRENEVKCGAWGCSDLQTDYFNCGACGVKCPSETPVQTCCNSTCRNLQSDPESCGTCGHACSPGLVCCAGNCVDPAVNPCQCEPVCPIGETCCNRRCVDLLKDDENCGKCGNACSDPRYAREFCAAGMCLHIAGI